MSKIEYVQLRLNPDNERDQRILNQLQNTNMPKAAFVKMCILNEIDGLHANQVLRPSNSSVQDVHTNTPISEPNKTKKSKKTLNKSFGEFNG